MRKISSTADKGGVGKTTNAVHIAYALATGFSDKVLELTDSKGRVINRVKTGSWKPKKVLLVDLDKQNSASEIFGVWDDDNPIPGLSDAILAGKSPKGFIKKARANRQLYVLPAGTKMAKVVTSTMEICRKQGIASPADLLPTYLGFLDDIGLDFVIIDNAAGLEALGESMMRYAEELLVSVDMTSESIRALKNYKKVIDSVGRNSSGEVTSEDRVRNIDYVLPIGINKSATDLNRTCNEMIQEIVDESVVLPGISTTTDLTKAALNNKTIIEANPRHAASKEYWRVTDIIVNGRK